MPLQPFCEGFAGCSRDRATICAYTAAAARLLAGWEAAPVSLEQTKTGVGGGGKADHFTTETCRELSLLELNFELAHALIMATRAGSHLTSFCPGGGVPAVCFRGVEQD